MPLRLKTPFKGGCHLDDFGTAASLYVKHTARDWCNISSAAYTIFHSVLLMFKTL